MLTVVVPEAPLMPRALRKALLVGWRMRTSLTMVSVACDGLPSSAPGPAAFATCIRTVLLLLTTWLLKIGTNTFWLFCPTEKVTVWLTMVKSTPGVAVPLVVVKKFTDTVFSKLPSRTREMVARPSGAFSLRE